MVTVLRAGEFEASEYGLVNSRTLANGSERWQSGFTVESDFCQADVDLLDVCLSDLEERVIEKVAGAADNGDYLPFGVKATVECSTLGGLRQDWDAKALAALEQCHHKAIELEFWEGNLAQAVNVESPGANPNRYLATGATDVNSGGAVKARYGLALLEGALADVGCGGKGWIHMPRSIASVLPLKPGDDGVLRTMLGNYVIAGDGYTGLGTGSSATTKWMYATGPVSVRMDDAEVVGLPAQNINTNLNNIQVSAERLAAVTWDGCVHLGVRVDLTLDYA